MTDKSAEKTDLTPQCDSDFLQTSEYHLSPHYLLLESLEKDPSKTTEAEKTFRQKQEEIKKVHQNTRVQKRARKTSSQEGTSADKKGQPELSPSEDKSSGGLVESSGDQVGKQKKCLQCYIFLGNSTARTEHCGKLEAWLKDRGSFKYKCRYCCEAFKTERYFKDHFPLRHKEISWEKGCEFQDTTMFQEVDSVEDSDEDITEFPPTQVVTQPHTTKGNRFAVPHHPTKRMSVHSPNTYKRKGGESVSTNQVRKKPKRNAVTSTQNVFASFDKDKGSDDNVEQPMDPVDLEGKLEVRKGARDADPVVHQESGGDTLDDDGDGKSVSEMGEDGESHGDNCDDAVSFGIDTGCNDGEESAEKSPPSVEKSPESAAEKMAESNSIGSQVDPLASGKQKETIVPLKHRSKANDKETDAPIVSTSISDVCRFVLDKTEFIHLIENNQAKDVTTPKVVTCSRHILSLWQFGSCDEGEIYKTLSEENVKVEVLSAFLAFLEGAPNTLDVVAMAGLFDMDPSPICGDFLVGLWLLDYLFSLNMKSLCQFYMYMLNNKISTGLANLLESATVYFLQVEILELWDDFELFESLPENLICKLDVLKSREENLYVKVLAKRMETALIDMLYCKPLAVSAETLQNVETRVEDNVKVFRPFLDVYLRERFCGKRTSVLCIVADCFRKSLVGQGSFLSVDSGNQTVFIHDFIFSILSKEERAIFVKRAQDYSRSTVDNVIELMYGYALSPNLSVVCDNINIKMYRLLTVAKQIPTMQALFGSHSPETVLESQNPVQILQICVLANFEKFVSYMQQNFLSLIPEKDYVNCFAELNANELVRFISGVELSEYKKYLLLVYWSLGKANVKFKLDCIPKCTPSIRSHFDLVKVVLDYKKLHANMREICGKAFLRKSDFFPQS